MLRFFWYSSTPYLVNLNMSVLIARLDTYYHHFVYAQLAPEHLQLWVLQSLNSCHFLQIPRPPKSQISIFTLFSKCLNIRNIP
jgi:hypothetical protein